MKHTPIRFAVAGIAGALALVYGCQDENKDGSPSALGPAPVTVFAEDFSEGLRRDRLVVTDERHARVDDRASTGPALVMGPTTARTASTFTPAGRTEVRFDVGLPVHSGGAGLFRFTIDGTAVFDTFFEIGFDFTGRVLILGFEVPIALSGPGNHSILFVIDESGDAHWFIDGALALSRAGFPQSPFGLGLQGSGSADFIVDNVSVTVGP